MNKAFCQARRRYFFEGLTGLSKRRSDKWQEWLAMIWKLQTQLVRETPDDALLRALGELGLQGGSGADQWLDELPLFLLVMDYLVYNVRSGGKRFEWNHEQLGGQGRPGADEIKALRAMPAAYLSLFRLTRVETGRGCWAEDVWRGRRRFLSYPAVDPSIEGSRYIFRVLPFCGWNLLPGAIIPAIDTAGFRREVDALLGERGNDGQPVNPGRLEEDAFARKLFRAAVVHGVFDSGRGLSIDPIHGGGP